MLSLYCLNLAKRKEIKLTNIVRFIEMIFKCIYVYEFCKINYKYELIIFTMFASLFCVKK